MLQSKYLAWPAYLVAVAMMLIPMADAWTTLFPWHLGQARWRFAAVGLISNALMIPLAGILIAFAVAAARRQRLLLRVIGIGGFAAAILCGLALVSFVLDALQTRAGVNPDVLLSFHVASVTAALKTALAAATFLAFGFSGWNASRQYGALKSSGAAGELYALPTAPTNMKRTEHVELGS